MPLTFGRCGDGTALNEITQQCEISCAPERRALQSLHDSQPFVSPPLLDSALRAPPTDDPTSTSTITDLLDDDTTELSQLTGDRALVLLAHLLKNANDTNADLRSRLADQLFRQPAPA